MEVSTALVKDRGPGKTYILKKNVRRGDNNGRTLSNMLGFLLESRLVNEAPAVLMEAREEVLRGRVWGAVGRGGRRGGVAGGGCYACGGGGALRLFNPGKSFFIGGRSSSSKSNIVKLGAFRRERTLLRGGTGIEKKKKKGLLGPDLPTLSREEDLSAEGEVILGGGGLHGRKKRWQLDGRCRKGRKQNEGYVTWGAGGGRASGG